MIFGRVDENKVFDFHDVNVRDFQVKTGKAMAYPIVKEEKIEVKRGLLNFHRERVLKPWKKRYFVFCQIRRGDSNWLKLFYYKNSSCYKEEQMPTGMYCAW